MLSGRCGPPFLTSALFCLRWCPPAPVVAAEDVLCVSVPRWPDKPEFPRALFLKFRSIIRDTLHCGVVTGVDLWQRHLQARCIDTGNQQSATTTHIRIQLRVPQSCELLR